MTQNLLFLHIDALNRKLEASGSSCSYPLSPAYWEEWGITTPAQFDRMLAEEFLSDIWKDENGYRPRNIQDWTDEEIKEAIDAFTKEGKME